MQKFKEIALENIFKADVEQKQGRLAFTKDLEGVLYQRMEDANHQLKKVWGRTRRGGVRPFIRNWTAIP